MPMSMRNRLLNAIRPQLSILTIKIDLLFFILHSIRHIISLTTQSIVFFKRFDKFLFLLLDAQALILADLFQVIFYFLMLSSKRGKLSIGKTYLKAGVFVILE